LRGVRHRKGKGLDALLQELQALVDTAATDVDKQTVVRLLATMVPTMRHVETGRHLDQRM